MKRTLEGGSGGGGGGGGEEGEEEAGGVTPSKRDNRPSLVSTDRPGVRQSHGAAEEKQIADLSGTGPRLCLGGEVSDSRESSRPASSDRLFAFRDSDKPQRTVNTAGERQEGSRPCSTRTRGFSVAARAKYTGRLFFFFFFLVL